MAKSACFRCHQPIEFPDAMAGQTIDCPSCGEKTVLGSPPVPSVRIPKNALQKVQERPPAESIVGPVAARLVENMERVILGKRRQILLVLAAFLAEGHVLLEDVPGVAKTMLARSLAQSVGGKFKRAQCTPDLLPNDITGSSIFNPKTTEFEFRPGPVFTQILLADEINRATPRAQAALLEAMAERQVTVDGQNYTLERPFFLIATQNPVDHEGTFPLPEAQLDRFLIRLSLGYPGLEEESGMLERFQVAHPIETLQPVVAVEEMIECQQAVRQIQVDEKVRAYILALVRGTREHEAVRLGASPRASLALFRMAQAMAGIQGYDFVLPDDVKEVAPFVLAHRLIVKPESRLRKITAEGVVNEVLNRAEVPTLKLA